ncbi:AfsR/SARP family transcriptional regulator [Actinoplanes derwentensis]|uniref:DNA-binding transcriptional activator of the SARP family n=1 Tax=Actinoplanes derwentensis TaxID=113562 RepID=A0A1H2DF75_9ACTN|nr:BTAD domain-containing putative transcriptional regulator [Actinoplanes derwentensis]GID85005.1 SARP family transcriptional regulator [Actinoplanes derwentensis]SDT81244.1 DNA-binding transcriptional activator of the SARP family [Actinoplanes derwentensis]
MPAEELSSRMAVRVLGSLEVSVAGTPVSLGGPQQRAVLAMLVAAGGRAVPAGRIVERLWGGAPPPQPLVSLQAYISRLRKVIEPERAPRGEASVLVLEPAGYALRLPVDAVDAWCLEREVAAAESQSADAALDTLRTALARWRGRPFEQFENEPWARPEIDRLCEVRLAGRRRTIVCLLRLGHTGDACLAAQGLAEANPARGDLWWLYALGLWAAHRSAEALDTIRRYRRLAGASSAELAELERAILEQRRDVLERHLRFGETGGETEPATGAAGRPAQLPREPEAFAARKAELAELDRQEDGLVVITGPGGVGKTTLAVRWAHRVAGRYPDGQLYADLRGFGPEDTPAAPADVLAGFLGALGVPNQRVPPGQAERAALLRSVLAGRRMLLVLDNARDTEQVRPLLPGTAGCAVVVTSRDTLGGLIVAEGAFPVRLGGFRDDEARAFLRARLGAAAADADPAATATIVARCGGLPLALAVVCARAEGRPLAAVAAELADDDGLDAFTGSGYDLRAVFSWSYRRLPAAAAALFRRLALHPGPDVALNAAAGVSGLSRGGTRALLRSLADAHLLQEREPGRFAFHDLVRGWAVEVAEREDPVDVHQGVLRGLVEYHLHSADNAVNTFLTFARPDRVGAAPDGIVVEQFDDAAAALAWMAGAYENVMALAAACEQPWGERYLGPLVWTLMPYQQDFRFLVDDSIGLCLRALPVAERTGDDWLTRYLLFMLGRAYLWLNEMAQARVYLNRVIRSARSSGIPINLAQGLIALVTAITGYIGTPSRESVRQAHPHAVEALETYRLVLSDPVRGVTAQIGEARCLLTIAWWHFYFGDGYDAAAKLLDQSLETQLRKDNGQHAAEALLHIGYLRHESGEQAGAAEAFQRVLDEHGDVAEHRMDPLIGLYLVHTATGDRAAAERVRSEASRLAESARYHDVERLRTVLGTTGEPGTTGTRA